MILRRFPWKIPDAKQDASYRLYVQSHPELSRAPPSEEASSRLRPKSSDGNRNRQDSVLSDTSTVSSSSFPKSSSSNEEAKVAELTAQPVETESTPKVQEKLTAAELVFSRPIPKYDAPEKDPLTVPASPRRRSPADLNMSEMPKSPNAQVEHTKKEAPLASHPPSPTVSSMQLQQAAPGNRARGESVSAASIASSAGTLSSGAADSIFRLLPRESRPALMRMLAIEPRIRATLADLLRGGEDGEIDKSKADPWIASLRCCTGGSCKAEDRIKAGQAEYHTHTLLGSNNEPEKKKRR